jgi:hypothetical protein
VERPPPLAAGAGLVGGLGAGQRLVGRERDDRVQLAVVARDPIEHARGQLDGGDLAAADGAGRGNGRGEVEIGDGAARRAGAEQARARQRRAAGKKGPPAQAEPARHHRSSHV